MGADCQGSHSKQGRGSELDPGLAAPFNPSLPQGLSMGTRVPSPAA